ncbi:FxsA family protein [Azotobacter vinelandii]|uniref:FxsA family protein n=1 Tax=Azotobacter vinelandii TaxID=354 RepID=UPI000773E0A4|nr:FxsA family protein [Azotobacter vinelandii]WKN23349.1 membrane protein FxsA [Azotobacter vinelandii]
MRAFLLLFLLFPLLELAVMIKVGSAIGVLPTLLLIVLGVLVGGLVLRLAGVATAWRARERLARGELPEQEMLDGLLIAIGGGLLLLPGFVSDLLAIPCLLPFTRHFLLDRLRRRTEEQALRRRAFFDDLAARSGQSRPEASPRSSHPNVIEGEYERRDD